MSARDARGRADAAASSSIFLVRHGRPALDRSANLDWRGYKAWWAAYDKGGLAADQEPPDELAAAAQAADVLLASPLTRSLETAHALAPGREVAVDSVFVEAALPPPPIPGLRLRPGPWGVFARIAWWLGYSGGMESRQAAERRAEAAVDRVLASLGEPPGGTALVCAHGWFNRMMRPVLLSRGWRCVRDGRDGYWSYRLYERAK